jgi:hypothetical protein
MTFQSDNMTTIDLKIEYSNPYASKEFVTPVFLRHQGIRGKLSATNLQDHGVEKVKIVLKGMKSQLSYGLRLTDLGTLRNAIGHACAAYYQPHKLLVEQTVRSSTGSEWAISIDYLQILKLTDVQDSLALTRDDVAADDDKEEFTFNFQLRPGTRFDSHADCQETDLNRTLPSSLNVHGPWCTSSTGQPCCFFDSRVKYEIQAFAYASDMAIATTSQEIRVYDTEDPFPPPIHTAHFPGEYVCQQEKRLKKLLKIRGNRLSISVAEPKPLEVPAVNKPGLAAFQMRFAMRGFESILADAPGALDVRINSALKVTTYVAVGSMESHPTLRSTETSPLLATLSRNCRVYHRKLRLSGWRIDPDECPGAWMKDILVWLPVIEGSCPTPTFFTSYLTRRYSVAMRIDVKSSAGAAVFYLNVPIQIVYSEAPVYSERSSMESNPPLPGPDRLPLYSR